MNRKERRAALSRKKGTEGRSSLARTTNSAAAIHPLAAMALRHHQVGQLAEAEELYRKILVCR
jgi:hypothetical protein